MNMTLNHPVPDPVATEHYTTALFNVYISGAGLTSLVQTAAKLLGNPVIVFDASYKILAYSAVEEIDDYLWKENISRGYCSYDFIAAVNRLDSVQKGKKTDFYEVTCEETANTKLICKIKVGGKVMGNVLLLGCTHSFRPGDPELLSITSAILAEEMSKRSYYRQAHNIGVEDFICGLLEERHQERDSIEDRMKSAGVKLGDRLLLLLFDLSRYTRSDHGSNNLQMRLQQLFPGSPTAYYEENIVMLHEGPLSKELPHRLHPFLAATGISLGVSHLFSDLTHCRHFYLQSKSALRIGSLLHPEQPLTYYADVQLYELLSADATLSEGGTFSHPDLLKLQHYDAKHQANLYDTFYTYLKNNRNMQQTADALYIHRNTLRYKLGQIQKLLDTDFADSAKMLNYHVSYKVAYYYERLAQTDTSRILCQN